MEQAHVQNDVDARLAAAHAAIDELRAEVAELRRERGNPRPVVANANKAPIVSRRALFGLAGAGIAGVAVGAGASPAAAADGDPVLLGQDNTSTGSTSIESSEGIGMRVATTDAGGSGLALLVENPGYKALWSISGGEGGIGVDGSATGRGGIGVLGTAGGGDAHGVIGDATGGTGGVGVTGLGQTGVHAFSEFGTGLSAGAGFGVGAVIGTRTGSQLHLIRDTEEEIIGPSAPWLHHDRGEISLDSRGDLFLCTAAGTPGTWTQLNHQGAAFLPTAERAFDSRVGREPLSGGGSKGLFAIDESRTIDLTTDTGLPADARAAIINLTVTGTVRVGYLSVYPGDAVVPEKPTFSHINWSTSGQTIANTTTVTVTDGKVRVYAAQPTHVLIDVIGWYP